jgi:hypothetical protein
MIGTKRPVLYDHLASRPECHDHFLNMKRPRKMTVNVLFQNVSCRYFTKPGPANTGAVLEAAGQRAKELAIGRVVVASCTGRTAFAASKIFAPSARIIAVTHVTGFAEPNVQEMSEENRRALKEQGVEVLTCAHAFGGIGRGVRNKIGTYQIDEIIAFTFRTFGQGTKVAVEIALMAADAGFVRTDEDVISIGGSGRGADTALVLRPATSSLLFDLKVKEVICKPANP